jgi:glyoxylase-like metal-dependent hydrolase (beta-lactamase superfamily II)
MIVEQIKVGFMDVFCYLVACSRTKEALFIDPAGNEEELVNYLKQEALTLKYIVNTHGHADHTCGNQKVRDLTGARIVMHETDNRVFSTREAHAMARQWGFEPSPPADETVEDGDKIVIGDVYLEVIHTPGHSPGGICLLSDGNLFTGDTLFVGGIGRTDLPGSSHEQFMESIQKRLMILPPETIVWPGHDYGPMVRSTIGYEKATNPWLQ